MNANIFTQTSGDQSYNEYLKLGQLKTVIFLHWCLICALLLNSGATCPQKCLQSFLLASGKIQTLTLRIISRVLYLEQLI